MKNNFEGNLPTHQNINSNSSYYPEELSFNVKTQCFEPLSHNTNNQSQPTMQKLEETNQNNAETLGNFQQTNSEIETPNFQQQNFSQQSNNNQDNQSNFSGSNMQNMLSSMLGSGAGSNPLLGMLSGGKGSGVNPMMSMLSGAKGGGSNPLMSMMGGLGGNNANMGSILSNGLMKNGGKDSSAGNGDMLQMLSGLMGNKKTQTASTAEEAKAKTIDTSSSFEEI